MQIPQALIQSLKQVNGFREEPFIRSHESAETVTAIRYNPTKSDSALFEKTSPVPWSSRGHYLAYRPSFTTDPNFHAGAYYVQDASSMFLEHAVRATCNIEEPLKVLDLCAAPGGKSTLLQSIISSNSLLVSNEVIRTRIPILIENISKWGCSNVIVTQNDPKHFSKLTGYFDLVVVDAPCSGSGLFRKDPDAIGEWSEQNVNHCSLRQQRILEAIIPVLKPGGILIYATCSFSVEEDEAITEYLLQLDGVKLSPIKLPLNPSWGIVETTTKHNGYGYRFFPDQLKGEGFYLSVFRNEKEIINDFKDLGGRTKLDKAAPSKTGLEIIKPWILNPEAYDYISMQEDIIAIQKVHHNDFKYIQSKLYIRKAGVNIGRVIRDELIPDHELAMSKILQASIPVLDLDLENALQYLRKQDIRVDSDKRGWALVRFEKSILGWVKILQNRVNNYYPKSLRILNK